MKVFNVSIMLSVQLTYILLFLSLCASVFSFPSTPLNERSQEISWQAWLLVDDQNQNRQSSDGIVPRRRIIPKSVFVAPTFSPENLPPCAEGYSSDAMGRCIKIIKLDEDRHLEFLVSKLNDKFGVIDYEEELEEIDSTKSEPFQLNIPLSLDEGDYNNDTPQEDLDFAIIVTPTTTDNDKSKDNDSKVDKRNDQSNEDMYEEELKKLLKMATTKKYDHAAEDINLHNTEVTEEYTTFKSTGEDETETATVHTVKDMETTTTVMTTGDTVEMTTLGAELNEDNDEHNSAIYSEDFDVTTSTEVTTTLEGTTEEFTTFVPLKERTSSTTPKITTTTPKITTYHPRVITYHPYFDMSLLDNSKTKNLIKFPDEESTIPRSHPDGSFVRFPDVDSEYQQESQAHHTRDTNDQSGNFFNEIVTSEPSQHVQEMVLPPKEVFKGHFHGFFPSEPRHFGPKSSQYHHSKFFPSSEAPENVQRSYLPLVNHHNYKTQMGATTEKFPGKNRKEKHGSMFVLPPKWSESNHQKPLVIRFSRKHFNVDTNKFKNNEFYRSLPMDDLSFLFGYKHGQTSHR